MLQSEAHVILDNPTQELELENCSVLIYRHLSFMHITWNDRISLKDYRANTLQVLQMVTLLKIKYFLSDAHQLKLPDNNEWFLQVCTPVLLKSGIHKIARIIPYNPAAITQSLKLSDLRQCRARTLKPAYDFEAFTDLDAAFHWLEIKQPAYSKGQPASVTADGPFSLPSFF